MEVRSELVKSAIMEYIEETFAGMEFGVGNVCSLMLAKIVVENKFNSIVALIADDDGMIPVDLLEKYGTEAITKLGAIEIPKLGGKMIMRPDDFSRLMTKIKSKGEM